MIGLVRHDNATSRFDLPEAKYLSKRKIIKSNGSLKGALIKPEIKYKRRIYIKKKYLVKRLKLNN